MPQTPRRSPRIAGLIAALLGVVAVVAGAPVAAAQEVEVGSQPAALRVTVTVDRPELVVDLDEAGNPTAPAVLTYDVQVANTGDGLLTGVTAEGELPAGLTHAGQRVVRLSFGDLGAAAVARQLVAVDVDPHALDGTRVEFAVTARSADGHEARSEPAGTDVLVISARTIVAEPPAVAATPSTTAPAPDVTLPPLEQAAADGTASVAAATDELPAAPAPRWLVALAVATTLVSLAALTRRAQQRAILPPG